MSQQQGVERVDKAKRANRRESTRLQHRIDGHLSAEHKYILEQMEHKKNLTRRELAANELERRKNTRKNSDGKLKTRLSKTDDPTEVLKSEIEKDKIQNKLKMLEKSKKKNEKMNGKVKNFMDKLVPVENVDKSTEKENVEEQKNAKAAGAETTAVADKGKLPTQKSFEHAYEEAKKTRYVRSKEVREFEVELSIQEVFKR